MITELKISPRHLHGGAGIYQLDNDSCYLKLFVTDTGKVIPVSGRVLSEEDLIQAYLWGREDAQNNPTTEPEIIDDIPF